MPGRCQVGIVGENWNLQPNRRPSNHTVMQFGNIIDGCGCVDNFETHRGDAIALTSSEKIFQNRQIDQDAPPFGELENLHQCSS
jgi:hypothetical protein